MHIGNTVVGTVGADAGTHNAETGTNDADAGTNDADAGDALTRPSPEVGRVADRVATALGQAESRGDRESWLAVVRECQRLSNVAVALQDAAIAEVVRREPTWLEDGTLGETVHGRGRVALDAADVVAPAIGASHPQAERRVEHAVRVAGGRVPVDADDPDHPQASGLGALHEAMGTGQLDGYRSSVVANELELAPAHVAEAVVAALSPCLGDDASALRRRTRALLARISPDLLRERAKRARASTGLRRWVAEPGVDEWHGTFPSEDAARAWAAIDRLAHDLVAEGPCTNLEQARGRALTDLVTGNATVEVQVHLTVPADSAPPTTASPTTAEPFAGSTGPVASPVTPPAGVSHRRAAPVSQRAPAGELLREGGADDLVQVQGARPSEPLLVPRDRPLEDGGADDLVQVQGARPSEPLPLPRDRLLEDGGADDLVQVQGARPSEPLLVPRGWLVDQAKAQARFPRRSRGPEPVLRCDPVTGARLDVGDRLATDAYRPGEQLARLVRARDGRCRFPGCSVAARFCDLDHVRPWPVGPTAAHNLLSLCRRHHRIKQRPGWRLQLAPDGTATWVDPGGRLRTTSPLDALASLVLVAAVPGPAGTDVRPADSTAAGDALSAAACGSALEAFISVTLEHRGIQPHVVEPDDHVVITVEHPWHRRCTATPKVRSTCRPRGSRSADTFPDIPPF